MRRLTSFVALAATSIALAGCTGGSKPAARPSPTSTVPPYASELQSFATAGTVGSYSATYLFHLAKPRSTATVKVWQVAPSLRIDVISGTTTASLFITRTGTYSCGVKPRHRACFFVAKAGQPIPAPFNVGPASLFYADLNNFARHGSTYTVTPAPASKHVLLTNCFNVSPGALTPKPVVQSGTYCISSVGVLTAVTYPSGNSAELTAFSSTVLPANLKPYAPPKPLPS